MKVHSDRQALNLAKTPLLKYKNNLTAQTINLCEEQTKMFTKIELAWCFAIAFFPLLSDVHYELSLYARAA